MGGRRMIAALLAFAWLTLWARPALSRPPATVVEDYRPAIPAGAPRAGSCWTSSIASNRSDAWRCTVGNEIFDPCFFAADSRTVVCDADPRRPGSGFVLRLTKPLPAPDAGPGPPQPFMVGLSDGSICTRFTGTMALVAGQLVRFGCPPASACGRPDCLHYRGLSGLHPGRLWHARELTYRAGRDGPVLIRSSRVPVATVWR